MRIVLGRIGFWIFLALAVLSASLFWLGPTVARLYGEVAGNMTYVVIRVLTILLFAFFLAFFTKRTRFSVLSTTTFVMFIDQIFFRGAIMIQDMRANPAEWGDGGLGKVGFALFASYVMFLPLVVLIGMIGYEAGRALTGRKNRASV